MIHFFLELGYIILQTWRLHLITMSVSSCYHMSKCVVLERPVLVSWRLLLFRRLTHKGYANSAAANCC